MRFAVGLSVGLIAFLPAAPLVWLHQDKHGQGFDPEFENMVLQNFRRFLADKCTVVTGRRDGALLGFVVVQEDGDSWRVGVSGWDEARSRPEENVYFSLVAADDESQGVLGLWTSHVCLSYGRPFAESDITAIYRRGE